MEVDARMDILLKPDDDVIHVERRDIRVPMFKDVEARVER